MHASQLKLPDTVNDQSPIPGTTTQLPAPAASEELVFMPDSLFKHYRDLDLNVTHHYHVLYIKTDSVVTSTAQTPQTAGRLYTGSFIWQ